MPKLVRLSLFAVLVLLFSLPMKIHCETLEAEKGMIDCSPLNFEGKNVFWLNGQWKFTRDHFSDPGVSFSSAIQTYTSVPGNWISEDHPEAHGFGTYRLLLTGLDDSKEYSLYVPDMVTSHSLYINGKEKGENGLVGSERSQYIPVFNPYIISFHSSDGNADVVIHVSNFDYRKGGIWRSPALGSLEAITFMRISRIILEVAIASILFSIAVLHIGIYISRKEEKAEFFFGLICLTFLIRILSTGEQVFTWFFPMVSWELLRKLEFIPFYASAPLLSFFMSTLFPKEASRIFNRLFSGIGFGLGLFIWIFPVRISNHLIPFGEVYVIIGIIYALWILARAYKNSRKEAPLLTLAYLIFAVTVVNDILHASHIIPSLYISPLGFVIFMIIQSQMLISRFSRSFAQRDQLTVSRDHFRDISLRDGMTGLFNVRYLHDTLEDLIAVSREEGNALSLIMADVDNFKLFNDTWGHKQGDEVLKKMADIIKGSAREKDSPCRYGGEEFSLILPETTLEKAAEVSERIRSRFEEAGKKDERMHGITVSIGVAQYRAPESVDEVIDRADKALYRAKDKGKNRVVKAL